MKILSTVIIASLFTLSITACGGGGGSDDSSGGGSASTPPSNILPVSNAGSDKNVMVNNSITITGIGSDSDGTITKYEWKKGSTLLASTASFNYAPTTVGTDTLTLNVTDNDGATHSDSMNIMVAATPVANNAPMANAGSDKSVEVNKSITITGIGSDSDGTITKYEWKKGSTLLASTASFNYTPTSTGTDTLTLIVTDNDGATHSDSMNVMVAATPVANNTIVSSAQRYYGIINNAIDIPSPGILVDDVYTGNPTIAIEKRPKNGTLSINVDGSFRYTPANGFTGSDSFDYSVSTTQGDSTASTVTLNIFNNSNYNPIQIVTQTDETSGLKHPGVLLSAQEIKAIGGALLSGNTIKDSYFSDMQGSTRGRWSSNNWKLSNSGLSYDLEGTTWTGTMKDAGAGASRYALAWMMKRDKTSEGYAIDILNEWAKVKSFTPDSNDALRHHRLAGSWFGFLAHAAEMLIYSDTSWPKSEQEAFKKTMRDVLLPIINEDRAISFNGNWDASATFGVLAIAVLLDDKVLFDKNIEYLKSGKTNARIGHYILPNGQNAETARDQTHAQMGIQFLALCAQVAWSQGIDLYEYEGRSIGKAYEYEALYNLGEDNVPFQFWPNPLHSGGSSIQTKAMIPSDIARSPFPIYEMVFHHYKTYRNVELPHSKKVLENHTRAEGAWAIGSSWSSVSYFDLDLSLEAPIRNAKKVTSKEISIDTTLPNKLILLNVGLNSVEAGSEQYVSQNGDVYVADYGLVSNGRRRSATDRNVSNTLEDKLYLNYRDNDGDLEYVCNVTNVNNGNYKVRLHFAELFESEINKRVFHIELEGSRVASDIDIFALVGKDSAYVVDFDVVVSDGVLNIDFRKVTGKTMLQGIEVIQMP